MIKSIVKIIIKLLDEIKLDFIFLYNLIKFDKIKLKKKNKLIIMFDNSNKT